MISSPIDFRYFSKYNDNQKKIRPPHGAMTVVGFPSGDLCKDSGNLTRLRTGSVVVLSGVYIMTHLTGFVKLNFLGGSGMSEVYRVHKTGDYTVLSNHHLKNRDLSLKAKGLMSQILSFPDSWGYSVRGLAAVNKDGKASVGSALNELIAAGYIYRHQETGRNGRFGEVVYEIFETPEQGRQFFEKESGSAFSPHPENRDAESPYPENRNSELSKTKKINNINNIYIDAGEGVDLSSNADKNTGRSFTGYEESVSDSPVCMSDPGCEESFPGRNGYSEDGNIATFYDLGKGVPMGVSSGVYSAVTEYTRDPSLREELFQYAEFRTLNRRSLTGHSMKLLLDKLSEIGHSDTEKTEIVKTAIRCRWWDFYPLRTVKEKSPKHSKPEMMRGNYDIEEIERTLVSNKFSSGSICP